MKRFSKSNSSRLVYLIPSVIVFGLLSIWYIVLRHVHQTGFLSAPEHLLDAERSSLELDFGITQVFDHRIGGMESQLSEILTKLREIHEFHKQLEDTQHSHQTQSSDSEPEQTEQSNPQYLGTSLELENYLIKKSLRMDIKYMEYPWPARQKLRIESESSNVLKKTASIRGQTVQFKLVTYDPKFDIWVSGRLQNSAGLVYEPEMITNMYQPEFDKQGVLEIGTNIGALSTPVSILLKNRGFVFGIEANPENFKIAASNAEINHIDNLWLFNYAVVQNSSNSDDMRFQCDPQNRGHCSLLKETKGESLAMNETWMRVHTISIDDLYNAYPKPMCEMGVMKIDVEGYEGQVILGADKYLEECPVLKIYLELNKDWLEQAGTPVSQVMDLLKKRQYHLKGNFTGGFGNYEFSHCSILSDVECT